MSASPPAQAVDGVAGERAVFHTIGHSNHGLDTLVAMLQSADIDLVVDVRAFPRSRSNPQFNIDTLPDALAAHGIGYRHMAGLGGRRASQPADADNGYWSNSGFRNFADYALTADFHAPLAELRRLGACHRVAIMCSESVWWRCHRRLIADYLLASGDTVLHIMDVGKVDPATMTPSAVPRGDGSLHYPATQMPLL